VESSTKHKRLEQLDALRAIAVLMVICYHWVPQKFFFHLPLGELGVTLFFVLSGYLITGILLSASEKIGNRPRTAVIRSFVARRALRILPIYYLFIGVSWFLSAGSFGASTKWHMFFLTNFEVYHGQAWPHAGGHLWTLSVEEQFYLIWPWLVLYVPRDYLMRVLGGILAIAILPVTLLIGYASWFIIEKPINALKVFFPYITTDVRAAIKSAHAVRLNPAVSTNN
jgi:peptidoglycan/LPS O-acetylase OafA/YrhL